MNASKVSETEQSKFLSTILIFIFIFAPTISLLQWHLSRYQRIEPRNVPWVGVTEGEWFARARGQIREWWNGRENILQGYHKYSKMGKPFLSPQVNWKPEVVIPPEHVRWLVEQPDSIFSIHKVLIDDLRFDYTAPRAWDFDRPFHVEALNKMNLDAMTDDIWDEIDFRSARVFGTTAGQPHVVNLQDAMFEIILAITNRVFAGKALARDDDYTSIVASFVCNLPRQAALIDNVCPTLLKPLFAPLLARPIRRLICRYEAHMLPTIHARLAEATAIDRRFEPRDADVVRLMARAAARSPAPRDRDARNLASRLLALSFVGVHTSCLTAVAAAVDFLRDNNGPGQELWSRLRAEAAAVLRSSGGVWSRAGVARLVLLDSALRESMRISPFKGRGLEREVVARAGVVLPDGTHLPRGTKVGAPTVGIQRDERFYHRPDDFVCDRFVGKAELGMVNTTDTFLAFGHGRHACPGRFFSTYELKLLFAHLVLNYDLEPLEHQPHHVSITDFFLLSAPYMLKAHRREKSAHLE